MSKKISLAFAVLGIIAPVTLFLFIAVLGVFWPTYNPISGYVSDLGAHASPFWLFFDILAFGLFGIVMIGFCFVLERHLKQNDYSPTATRLFLAGSVFVILLGFFHTDIGNAPPTVDGRIHTVFGSLAFLALTLSLIWYGLSFRVDPEWENFWQLLSIILGVLAFIVAAIILVYPRYYYAGTIERFGIGAVLLWIMLVSINLYFKEKFE